ncbi:MAG: amino acid ABC transporter permease [Chloroflexi bacterium]|nr:amino acid ABC transporter permease [Chloroflexota bacterium]MBU1751307.1 amino acid ABC transporter permease [Chloroflexota bacterium]
MTLPIVPTSRPPALSMAQWLKENLFSTWYNALLTFVAGGVVLFVLYNMFTWIFFRADWTPVTSSFKLFAVGQYPTDQIWRVGAILFVMSFLMGASWGVWGGTMRTFALSLATVLGLVALAPVGLDRMDLGVRAWFIANPALTGLGYLLGRKLTHRGRWVMLGWLLSFVLTLLLLGGIPGVSILPAVDSGLWGGLLLTFLLALVGIVASFPIGLLLALGRQSSLPVLKVFCVVFIESIRGVPLVTILFMGSLILPLFLPEDLRIDRVLRAMLAMTLFAAAYMAENVRGGLQAIPKGQVEAAKAVGLNAFQTQLLIVLPQALRAVIPAIVGQFIALFMDTTLAVIVGLVELLAIGRAVLNSNPEWLLRDTEVYLFIALVFWAFTYSMSYASRRLEKALGVGER